MKKENNSDNESFKINLTAYDHRLLDSSVEKIVSVIKDAGATIAGPIPMPTSIKKYTVIKAPHEYNSKEQFEQRIHRRVIMVSNSNPKAVSSLSSLSLPAGVGIQIRQV